MCTICRYFNWMIYIIWTCIRPYNKACRRRSSSRLVVDEEEEPESEFAFAFSPLVWAAGVFVFDVFDDVFAVTRSPPKQCFVVHFTYS